MLIFKFAFVLLTILYQVFGLDKQCPNDVLGTGCICYFVRGFNDVLCQDVQNTTIIKEKFKDTELYDLKIAPKGTKVSKDFFKGLTIIKLSIYGKRTLKYIEDGSFNGLEETLQELYFYGYNGTELPNLRKLNNLKRVEIILKRYNGTFNQDDVDRLPLNIETFYSERSYFKNITANFSNYLQLENLSFMHGNVESIDRLIVGPNLKVLDFRFNHLKSFPVNFMKRAPNGLIIGLGANGIESFTKEEINVIIERNIVIHSNAMTYSCPCEMSWVIKMKEAVAKQLGNFECEGNTIRTFKYLLQLTDSSFEYC